MISSPALASRLISGGAPATADELLELLRDAPREELHEAAHRVTEALVPKRFDFCGIVNARSGRCPENCRWCAQSAHWKTGCEVHGWIGTEACVKAAEDAERNGVGRIGIVTSGRAQTPADVDALCDALRAMKDRTRIHLCGSLGLLSKDDLVRLKEAGLQFSMAQKDGPASEALSGMTVVISGNFSIPRDEMKRLIEANGGRNSGSVSGKTSFLLAGEKPGPEKIRKASALGIRIVSEKEFMDMLPSPGHAPAAPAPGVTPAAEPDLFSGLED
jgi:hypothetical protein